MNKIKSSVRCRVEHVFGAMKSRCRDEVLRTIGMARAKFWIGIHKRIHRISIYNGCIKFIARQYRKTQFDRIV
jgi:hypothetical protein